MTFFGRRRWTTDVHPHESPLTMTVPMVLLAVGSVVSGYLLVQGARPAGVADAGGRQLARGGRRAHHLADGADRSSRWSWSSAGWPRAVRCSTACQPVPMTPPVAVSPLTTAARSKPLLRHPQRERAHAAGPVPHPRPGVRRQQAASTGRSTAWRPRASAAGPAGCAGCRPASSGPTRCRCSPGPRSWSPPLLVVRIG